MTDDDFRRASARGAAGCFAAPAAVAPGWH
jgi:hypothetical protein